MLFKCLTEIGRMVQKYVMNPKAMLRQLLLGQIDHDTWKWSDRVLTAIRGERADALLL